MRDGKWLYRLRQAERAAPIAIHQVIMDVSVAILNHRRDAEHYDLKAGSWRKHRSSNRGEGEREVSGNKLAERDAAEVTDEAEATVRAKTPSHYICSIWPAE